MLLRVTAGRQPDLGPALQHRQRRAFLRPHRDPADDPATGDIAAVGELRRPTDSQALVARVNGDNGLINLLTDQCMAAYGDRSGDENFQSIVETRTAPDTGILTMAGMSTSPGAVRRRLPGADQAQSLRPARPADHRQRDRRPAARIRPRPDRGAGADRPLRRAGRLLRPDRPGRDQIFAGRRLPALRRAGHPALARRPPLRRPRGRRRIRHLAGAEPRLGRAAAAGLHHRRHHLHRLGRTTAIRWTSTWSSPTTPPRPAASWNGIPATNAGAGRRSSSFEMPLAFGQREVDTIYERISTAVRICN